MTRLRLAARRGPIDATVEVPGSKSVANRMLVCALLANGESTINGLPEGDDVRVFLEAMAKVGRCDLDGPTVRVRGGEAFGPYLPAHVDCALAGTSSRFLTAVGCLQVDPVVVDGGDRLRDRPMGDLHVALVSLGARVDAMDGEGRIPVRVSRGNIDGGTVSVRGDASSQFLSALMLIAPLLPGGLVISIEGDLVSRPYVVMTAEVMRMFGVHADVGDDEVRVQEGSYSPTDLDVERDHSAAAFPIAAALVAGGRVVIPRLGTARLQGDEQMLDIARAMGGTVEVGDDVTVTVPVDGKGRPRTAGITVDMSECSDLVPAVAIAATAAQGITTIRGVGFIRHKESDRLGDLAVEASKTGAHVRETDDGLIVMGRLPLHGAQVATHDDHRMAMALSLFALADVPIEIEEPSVVSKSWPTFYADMATVLGVEPPGNYSRAVVTPGQSPVVAAFDFDHTLTVSDSVVPFFAEVGGRLALVKVVLTNAGTVARLALRRDRNGLKELFAERIFSGRDVEAVQEIAVRHAERVVAGRMRADTASRLREHQRAGHVVVLVSASFGAYLHVIGDMLEVDAVLCTELEVQDGAYTGRLSGENCRGEEKRRRLSEWMREAGFEGESIQYAYGDSDGDTQMLEMATVSVRVGKDELSHIDVAAVPDGYVGENR
ncbi:MAG: 3-phosphoshikimate 1-carboxyvinyltransferase [Ilumatobacteraceae bacterium]